MRGLIEGLESPHPIGLLLPGLYHDDDFTQRFTSGLDDVLAPVLGVLDSLDAYFDPELAPLDFVEWLASWVGIELDENLPEARRRRLVAKAGELYTWAGTARGLAALVEAYTGVIPEIEDTGAVASGRSPGSAIPGSAENRVVVRVRGTDETIDVGRLSQLVRRFIPAHVVADLEVLPT